MALIHAFSSKTACVRKAGRQAVVIPSLNRKDLRFRTASDSHAASKLRFVDVHCVANQDKPTTSAAGTTKGAGRMTYRPQTFMDLITDVVGSIAAAVADGENRLEVEFPPLAGNADGKMLVCRARCAE